MSRERVRASLGHLHHVAVVPVSPISPPYPPSLSLYLSLSLSRSLSLSLSPDPFFLDQLYEEAGRRSIILFCVPRPLYTNIRR
jgi:hypothetical protein